MKRGSSRDPWGVRDERKAPAVCSEARENTEDGSSATAPQPGRLRREGHLLIHPPHAPRRAERPHDRRVARLKSPVAPYRAPKAKVRYCVAGHLKSSATPQPVVSDSERYQRRESGFPDSFLHLPQSELLCSGCLCGVHCLGRCSLCSLLGRLCRKCVRVYSFLRRSEKS